MSKQKKPLSNVELVIGILGLLVGVAGFSFGLYYQNQNTQIRERAGSPFLEVEDWLSFDASDDYIQSPGNYVYNEHPSTLEKNLSAKIYGTSTPDDYPDRYPLGLGLKNTGSKIKTFRVTSSEAVKLIAHERYDDFYVLKYFHTEPPSKLEFKLLYETFDGIQSDQTWELMRGSNILKRIKPKTP
jgi:hypothetical protein